MSACKQGSIWIVFWIGRCPLHAGRLTMLGSCPLEEQEPGSHGHNTAKSELPKLQNPCMSLSFCALSSAMAFLRTDDISEALGPFGIGMEQRLLDSSACACQLEHQQDLACMTTGFSQVASFPQAFQLVGAW